MNKALIAIIIILTTTLSISAQELSISTQYFSLKKPNISEAPTSYRRRASRFHIDERPIYVGVVALFRENVPPPSDEDDFFHDNLQVVVKYFIGYNATKFLITGNYEYNPDNTEEEKKIYGEFLYPVLGGFNKIFALSLYTGAGVNILSDVKKYNYNLNQYDQSVNETTLYIPMGAYIDYLNPMGGGTYGFRVGYALSYNSSDYRKNAFATDGFMFGALFRF